MHKDYTLGKKKIHSRPMVVTTARFVAISNNFLNIFLCCRSTTTSCLTLRLADNLSLMTDREMQHLIQAISSEYNINNYKISSFHTFPDIYGKQIFPVFVYSIKGTLSHSKNF